MSVVTACGNKCTVYTETLYVLIKFHYQLYVSPSNAYGGPKPDGSWDGMVGGDSKWGTSSLDFSAVCNVAPSTIHVALLLSLPGPFPSLYVPRACLF